HCHIVGAIRPQTLAQLATKHGLALPRPAEKLYEYRDFYDFIDVLRLAANALRDAADFERAAYEAAETGFRRANMRHFEIFFNPDYFFRNDVPYRTQVDGLTAGLRAAQRDFGVSGLLIACIDREWPPQAAVEMVKQAAAYRTDEVVGVGIDGPERAGAPEKFVEAYRLARQAGLKRTAHVCEDNQTLEEAPPRNLATCLDELACDRLDHGYNLLADPAMVQRAKESGVYFTACARTSVSKNRQKRLDGIRGLVDAGLNVTLNTDDPEMFHTDLADSYRHVMQSLGWGPQRACAFSLAGIEASWLDEGSKKRLRESFRKELDSLLGQLEPPGARAN
ncbi:MAG: adenosine deaminase, partial [Betaproteobacteria bacterium]